MINAKKMLNLHMKFKLKKDMRKIKFLAMVMVSAMAMVSCGGGDKPAESGDATASIETASTTEAPAEASKDGIGKFTSANFDGKDAFDAALAAKGKEIVDVKCTSCHNITEERKVGPGWKGVTDRRSAAWVMNFIMNPQPMIDSDPQAKALFEEFLTPMPNQNLTEDDAKAIYMYMRELDGKK